MNIYIYICEYKAESPKKERSQYHVQLKEYKFT